jgi:hypothetical protein
MSYDDKTPKIPKLTGALNYRIWAEEVRSYLESRGLLDLALGDEPKPANTVASTPRISTRTGGPSQTQQDSIETDTGVLSSQEAWRRKNAKARTYIMGYCSLTMKNKIIDFQTAQEQWEALRKDCRPSNDISLATYTSQFYGYEPKAGATIDSISTDLRDLQAFIFATDVDEAPTEKSKISALLRAVRKLGSEYDTRIEILEDKLSTLDFDSTVISLKETEQRLKSRSQGPDETVLAAKDQPWKRQKAQGTKMPATGGQGGYGGQRGKKRKGTCYCCGEEGHFKTECHVWLQTIEGKTFAKRAKGASTGSLPTPE